MCPAPNQSDTNWIKFREENKTGKDCTKYENRIHRRDLKGTQIGIFNKDDGKSFANVDNYFLYYAAKKIKKDKPEIYSKYKRLLEKIFDECIYQDKYTDNEFTAYVKDSFFTRLHNEATTSSNNFADEALIEFIQGSLKEDEIKAIWEKGLELRNEQFSNEFTKKVETQQETTPSVRPK